MAHRRNALKKHRQDIARRLRNRNVRSELKTLIRRYLELCSTKKLEEAKQFYPTLVSRLDKAVKRGVIKLNTASRKKSRLSGRLQVAKS